MAYQWGSAKDGGNLAPPYGNHSTLGVLGAANCPLSTAGPQNKQNYRLTTIELGIASKKNLPMTLEVLGVLSEQAHKHKGPLQGCTARTSCGIVETFVGRTFLCGCSCGCKEVTKVAKMYKSLVSVITLSSKAWSSCRNCQCYQP